MRDELAAYFTVSMQDFLAADQANIVNGVSELNLCGRLAMKLDARKGEYGFNPYHVDTEYNRNGGKVKTVMDQAGTVITIRCDIVVHSRGEILAQDNLIAIEMKRSNHSAREKHKDRERLRAMTRASYDNVWSADGITLPEHVCGYVLGYFLVLNQTERNFVIEEYFDGELARTFGKGF